LIIFRNEVNNSPYFETEAKRPFMYHCAQPEIIEQLETPTVMEVNEALKLAEEMFPPETGLYKKGALYDEKIIRLYFDFPLSQAQALEDRIKEFETLTGWGTEVNSECRLIAAENLVNEMLAGLDSTARKISYYREEKSLLVTLAPPLAHKEGIRQAFYDKTGLYLKFSDEMQKEDPVAAGIPGQMEQNKAFEYIDMYFSDMPHKPYKKSLKVRNGETGIELSFLTSTLGERYLSGLDEISARTYWNIWVSPTANQHELLKAAAECLLSYGISYKKLSFLPETQFVQATVTRKPLEEAVCAASDQFMEKTGSNLVIKEL